MDSAKIMLALSGLILLVCLVLSFTVLSSYRNAVLENESLQKEMHSLAGELDGCIDKLGTLPNTSPPDTQTEADVIVDESLSSDTFVLRAVGDRLGVYTADGILIRLLDTDLRTLPQVDRDLLKNGIEVASWQELLALIEDYEAH